MDTQTWIALGAVAVALGGAAVNVWNVNRSIRHNSAENDRRSLAEASDRVIGLLVVAAQNVSDIDDQVDGRYDLGHYRATERDVKRLYARADALRLDLQTARIVLLSRGFDVAAAGPLTDCVEAYEQVVMSLASSLEGWETPELDFQGMSINATAFHKAYDEFLGPHARLHGPGPDQDAPA